ncbi:MAG: hypothetical protein WDM90_11060 [Ferruginibacter sp.]
MNSYKFLFAFTILFQGKAICQNTTQKASLAKPDFWVGNTVSTRVNIDSFKLNLDIKATDGYKFKNATVYFSGANFQNVVTATIYGSSLSAVSNLVNKCTAGSSITFDDVKLMDNKNKDIRVDGKSYLFYSGEFVASKEAVKLNVELFDLMKKDFISGTIYFSGENFPNVVTVNIKNNLSAKTYFNRCTPGSKIAFENCVYKNADGTLSKPITKMIKMD